MRGTIAKRLRKLAYGSDFSPRVRTYRDEGLREKVVKDPITGEVKKAWMICTRFNTGRRAADQKLKSTYKAFRKQGKIMAPAGVTP